MNHTEIEKNNWLEKYLLHELNAKEESLLEEHLLYCDECVLELDQLKKTLISIKQVLQEEELPNAKQDKRMPTKMFSPVIYRFAAVSLLVLVIGSLIIYWNKKLPTSETSLATKVQVRTKQDTDSMIKTIPTKEKTEAFLSDAFVPAPIFESEIKNTYRSTDLSNVSPSPATSVKFGSTLKLSWIYNGQDSLILVILTNKGKEVLNRKVKVSYLLKTHLSPGLYYWQIQSETELLHISKFVVERAQ